MGSLAECHESGVGDWLVLSPREPWLEAATGRAVIMTVSDDRNIISTNPIPIR